MIDGKSEGVQHVLTYFVMTETYETTVVLRGVLCGGGGRILMFAFIVNRP